MVLVRMAMEAAAAKARARRGAVAAEATVSSLAHLRESPGLALWLALWLAVAKARKRRARLVRYK